MKIVSAAVDNATVTWFGAALLLIAASRPSSRSASSEDPEFTIKTADRT